MNFGTLELELYMLEVGIITLLYFKETGIVMFIVARIWEFMVRFNESVQLRKCLLASLESLCKILEFLDNGKTRFILEQFRLAN